MEKKKFAVKWNKGLSVAFLLADIFFLSALIYNVYDLSAHVIPAQSGIFLPLLFIGLYSLLCVIFLGITFGSRYVTERKRLTIRLGVLRGSIPYSAIGAIYSYPNDEYFLIYEKKGAPRTHQLLTASENCTEIIRTLLHENPSIAYEVYLDDHEKHDRS